jgi:glycosyltransferase involved in cell wall biosynthesis
MTRAKVILEAHEVDSLQAAERGEASAPARRLERAVLAGALGLVANAEGTLALLREVHGPLPPAVVIHNAAQPNRAKRERRAGIGYVGSTLPTKDLHTLARAASLGEHTVTVVGPRGSSDAELRRISADRMVFRPPVPSRDVPALLSGFAALALPLGRGLFGQHLTSPLKLWDYLASGVPVVAADTPSIRAAAPSGWLGYRPGDANHLAAQLHRVLTEPGLADRLVERAPHRDWGQRAAELDRLIDQVLP